MKDEQNNDKAEQHAILNDITDALEKHKDAFIQDKIRALLISAVTFVAVPNEVIMEIGVRLIKAELDEIINATRILITTDQPTPPSAAA